MRHATSTTGSSPPRGERWPALPLAGWRDTYETLHRYAQVIGKLPLSLSAHLNHWWQVPFHVGVRGLVTPAMPHDERTFEVELDFVDHQVVFRVSDGHTRALALVPRTVASFYEEVQEILRALELETAIRPYPVEIPGDTTPFGEDTRHRSYDEEAVGRFWQIVRQLALVFERFRGGFVGKSSPVQFYWGTFDLACSRYSGRRAPARPGADAIAQVAYSHELYELGFWPGGGAFDDAALYAFNGPAPAGLPRAHVEPKGAFWHEGMAEFLLPYDLVRASADPIDAILSFAQSTYQAGADLAGWDREALEPRRGEV